MLQQNINRVVELSKLSIQRFFWHSHAYITIFGVMFLTLVSLIFLSIHWFVRKLFLLPPIVEANQLDTSN